MKMKIITIITMVIICAIGITGCSPSIEKKQFESNDELISAFRNVSYSDVVKKLGEPYYKKSDLIDVNGDRQSISCRWKGVGVIGRPDAVIIYKAIQYSAGQIDGTEFQAMQQNENGY